MKINLLNLLMVQLLYLKEIFDKVRFRDMSLAEDDYFCRDCVKIISKFIQLINITMFTSVIRLKKITLGKYLMISLLKEVVKLLGKLKIIFLMLMEVIGMKILAIGAHPDDIEPQMGGNNS